MKTPIKDRNVKDQVWKQRDFVPVQQDAPFFRTEFNHDRMAVSDATGLKCEDPSLAQQQFRDDCDINILFARYLESGEMPQLIGADGPLYGDFTGIFDYQSAMNAVRTADGLFAQLPAKIKNRFDNDPQKLLAFLEDPENKEEAQFLGLINKDIIQPPASPGNTGATNETGTTGIPQGNAQDGKGDSGTSKGTPTPTGAQKS